MNYQQRKERTVNAITANTERTSDTSHEPIIHGPTSVAAAAPDGRRPARTERNERTNAKNSRRLEEALWVPNQSTPFRREVLLLKTTPAQYVYHLALVMAQKSLYFFYYTLPDNHEAVQAAETVVTSKIETVDAALTDELARMQAMVDGHLPDPCDGYTQPMRVEIAMYTPEAARFGTIVRNFDALVLVIDTLWFAGEVKRVHRGQLIMKYRKMIVSLARELFILSRRARNTITRQRLARDHDRQAQADAKEARLGAAVTPVEAATERSSEEAPTLASQAAPAKAKATSKVKAAKSDFVETATVD